MKVWVYLAALLAFSAPASPTLATAGPDIIPEAFPVRDTSQYTIRYLSESGNDTASCLSNQVYPQLDNTTQHCGSLVYALSGASVFRSYNVSNLIVLILPGSYSMGERGIEIFNYQNIVLSKLPDTYSGEVIIRCDRYLEDDFNNFYIVNAVNFALNGLVFTGCGSYSTPIRLNNSLNAVISNSTFRFVALVVS